MLIQFPQAFFFDPARAVRGAALVTLEAEQPAADRSDVLSQYREALEDMKRVLRSK